MKIGDYVRTKNGTIVKVKDKDYLYVFETEYREEYKVVKSSPNIIDLIQEGDYINGLRVEKNKYGELYTSYVYYGGDIGKQSEVYTTWLEEYKENEDYINSILTKEQFESMEYRIGE